MDLKSLKYSTIFPLCLKLEIEYYFHTVSQAFQVHYFLWDNAAIRGVSYGMTKLAGLEINCGTGAM